MKVKLIKVVTLSLLLTGCASFGEKVAQCQQETGADVNTCALIVQQQQQQQAQAWANLSAQLNAQQQQQAYEQQQLQAQNAAALQSMQQQQSLNNIANAIRGY